MQTDSIATQGKIQDIARQIAEQFHPARIILFGSYAYGVPTEDSDVDLLVLMDTKDSALHTAATISASLDHRLPLDIMVMQPEQLEASVKRGGVFATEVATRGIVLCETRDGGMDNQSRGQLGSSKPRNGRC